MKALQRAINGALRMGRRPESDRDVLTDIGVVAEEIGRQLPQAQRDARGVRLDQRLNDLPERDYKILQAWKSGMKRKEIAAQFGVSEIVVLHSLMRTYSGLRMKMRAASG